MKHEPIDTPSLTKLMPKHHSREALTKMLASVDLAEDFALENVTIAQQFTRKPHFTTKRKKIKLPPTRQQCNYHYEEFASVHERNARIEELCTLNIADGLQKITSQRENKIVWILAIPKRCSL